MWAGALEIIPVILIVQTCWSQAEVFSSVARLTFLTSLENKVIDHLDKVLSVSRQNSEGGKLLAYMERHLACMKQRSSTFNNSASLMENPVVGFRFLRRLVGQWDRVNLAVSKTTSSNSRTLIDNMHVMMDVLSKWQNWPQTSDLNGAAFGLLTVGQVYDLFPTPAWLDDSLTSTACTKVTIESQCTMLTYDRLQSMLAVVNQKRLYNNSILSISDKQKVLNRMDRNCEYNYGKLSIEDYLFITQVGLKYGMYSEAKRWFKFVDLFSERNRHASKRILAQVETTEKLFTTSPNGVFGHHSSQDGIHAAYVRLCRDSFQSNQQSPVPLRGWLRCFWKNTVLGYLRHKAEIIHRSPLITMFYDVISQNEINHVIQAAWTRLMPSGLHANHRTSNRTHLLRVSQTAWLDDDTEVLRGLSARVGLVTGLDTSQRTEDTSAEPFQIVNYGLGGLYVPHEDSVRRARLLGQESDPVLRGSGDRMATWMFYLSDVEAGGATVFPHLNVHVKPIKGSAILWYNLKLNGDVDKQLVHASCPVLLGDKWVANKWMRETGQMFHRRCSTHPDQ